MFLNTVGIEAVPGTLDELRTVNGLMQKNGEFRGFLENPFFADEDRERVMGQISGRLKLSDKTVKFILHLTEKAIISSLPELIHAVHALYMEKKRRAKAIVVTPIDTLNKYDDTLKSSLKKLTGRDVDIEYVIDPSLLGGVMVRVGSTMYDSSVKGQLRLLKDDLVKR